MKFEKVSLGDKVKDVITGYQGTVIAKTEWMNGCHRVTVQSEGLKEDGSARESHHCDVQQIELLEESELPKSKRSGGPRPNPSRTNNPKR